MSLEPKRNLLEEQREKNRRKHNEEEKSYKTGTLDKSSNAYKKFKNQDRLTKMKRPIYDAFIKKHPEDKLLEVAKNVGDEMSKPVIKDYHEAREKLFKKYPEIKHELEKIFNNKDAFGHGHREGSRMFNMVNVLRDAERFAVKEYADHIEDMEEIFDELEEVRDELTKIRYTRNINSQRKRDRLQKKQLYDLDPDNEVFEDNEVNTNVILNGPLIKMKKSNFKKKKEVNLLTMPSREKELEGLFGGKGKTMRKRKSNKRTIKHKKMFFGLF